MTESLYTALYLFLLLNLADFMTTRVAISQYGAREANPIARFILEKAGFVGLWAFKFALTGVLPLLAYLSGGDLETTLWIWNALYGGVVAWNSAQIVKYKITRG